MRKLLFAAVFSLHGLVHAMPARECIATDDKAIVLRKEGRLREAREQYLRCAEGGCPSDIRNECAHSVIEVTAAIPTIIVSVHDAAGNDLVAARVRLDGKPWLERLDGSAIPLDAGPHTLLIEAEGHPSITQTLVLREGEKDRRDVLSLPPSDVIARVRVREPTRRTIGVVTGAVGLLGLGVSLATSIASVALWSQSQAECNANNCGASAYQRAVADHDHAVDWANVATATLAFGATLLTVGGVLFFTAPYVVPGKTMSAGIVLGAHL